jgi:hypothetical protein
VLLCAPITQGTQVKNLQQFGFVERAEGVAHGLEG